MITIFYLECDDEDDKELIVDFNYYKRFKGFKNNLGVPELPDEPEEIEINSIKNSNNDDVELTEDQMDKIISHCLYEIHSSFERSYHEKENNNRYS